MHAGEAPEHSSGKHAAKQRLLVLVLGGFIALILIVFGAYLLQEEETSEATDTAISQSEEATATGDYEAALETLKQAENQAGSKSEKIVLYSNLAAAATNAGKLDEALDYYAKKHALDAASQKADGYLVGVIYERKGDTAKALTAYKQYVEYLRDQPESETSAGAITSTEELIQQLEASP
jgi:tetratricopeptide (TPR) repeat protein